MVLLMPACALNGRMPAYLHMVMNDDTFILLDRGRSS